MTHLRHVAAFVLLALSLAGVALWWRSYRVCDIFRGKLSEEQGFIAASLQGELELASVGPVAFGVQHLYGKKPRWSFYSQSASKWADITAEGDPYAPPFPRTVLGFAWESNLREWDMDILSGWLVRVPHWFLALLAAAAAFAVRPSPRFRFSLRQSLIAVTLAAVVFGAILGTIPRG